MNRKPNVKCCVCEKSIYRRPYQLKKFKKTYCSRDCLSISQRTRSKKFCEYCGIEFFPKHSGKNVKTCSRSCSNKNRKGILYRKNSNNNSSARLNKLLDLFNFSSCMVENCDYNKTYDIHRLIEGKNGGKYEIGNMFAICPNHHAELHRGLIKFEKINNYTLRIINLN